MPAHIGLALARGRPRHHVGPLDLPANIRRAIKRLSGQRRGGHNIVHAVVKPHRILRRVATATAAAGLLFGVLRFAEDDPVPVLSCGAYERFARNPAGDSLAFLFFFGCAFFMTRRPKNRFHVNPIMAGLEDNQFASTSRLAQLGGFCAGRNAHCFFVYQRSPLGLPCGERDEKEDACGNRNRGNR